MKLTDKQAELLSALDAGVTCFFMRSMGRFNPTAYYFRSDNMKRCTATVRALLDKGLAKKVNIKPYSGDHEVVSAKAIPKASESA